MRRRHLIGALMVLAILGSSIAVAADAVTKGGRLGYGFVPGLVAGEDYVAGQLIVGLKEGMQTQGATQAARALGGWVVKEIDGTAVLFAFASEAAVGTAVRSLLTRPEVAFVERNGFMSLPPKQHRLVGQKSSTTRDRVSPEAVSNDVATGFQWYLPLIRKTAPLPALSTSPPTIAVIDTGIDSTHPDLSGKVLLGLNTLTGTFDPFDDHGNGTHMAGIAAAKAGNGLYGEGISPNSRILAVKVLGANGVGTFSDVATGMSYARQYVPPAGVPAVRVLTMGMSGPPSALIAAQVNAIKLAGKVLVAAAGDFNASTFLFYPGADPNTALRVMATQERDCRYRSSNFSPAATPTLYNIAAPGFEIPSTLPDESFGSISGTAMAAPMVAGTAALVWGQFPAFTRDQLVTRIVNNAQLTTCGFPATTRRVDVRRALVGTAETVTIGRVLDPTTGKSPTPNTVSATVQVLNGPTVVASDLTNRGGWYEVPGLTAGSRELKVTKPGYSVFSKQFNAVSVFYIQNVVPQPKTRPGGDVTVTVEWKTTQPDLHAVGCTGTCTGHELDLVVKTPDSTYVGLNGNRGNLYSSPFVKSPRDSRDDDQSLEAAIIRSAAANGTYRVVVNRFSTAFQYNPSWVLAEGTVRMYNGATRIGQFSLPATCTNQQYWHVADLTKNGSLYTLTTKNNCTTVLP